MRDYNKSYLLKQQVDNLDIKFQQLCQLLKVPNRATVQLYQVGGADNKQLIRQQQHAPSTSSLLKPTFAYEMY